MMLFRPLNRSINQIDWLFFEVFPCFINMYIERKTSKIESLNVNIFEDILYRVAYLILILLIFSSNFFDIIHDESDN